MSTFSKVIADLDWAWITKMAVGFGCVSLITNRLFSKSGRRGLVADFGIGGIALLIFYHVSLSAFEVAFALWFGSIAAALIGLFWESSSSKFKKHFCRLTGLSQSVWNEGHFSEQLPQQALCFLHCREEKMRISAAVPTYCLCRA